MTRIVSPEDTPITPPTADEIVSASLSSGALLTVCDIDPTTTEREDEEEACIQDFAVQGCGCDVGPGRSQCSRLFPVEHYRSCRSTFAELRHDKLDLLVIGQVMAHTFQSTTLLGHHSSSPADRKTTYTHFYHQGHRVCRRTFLFIHTIGKKRFKNIKASYLQSGPIPRVHGNTGKRPKHHLSLQEVKDIVQYILNYTSKSGIDT